ncbi:hypothetical protein GCM10007898_43360 [Dyella flagellata]|uniref:Uncharacterized protein n=1 Tax=Dyella flagellata TaxID=1867833 RepID=A0ABQ5XGD4_9GAMM|nr:hypothetical protein GCM10007898_43360 [Dyella flagellata]
MCLDNTFERVLFNENLRGLQDQAHAVAGASGDRNSHAAAYTVAEGDKWAYLQLFTYGAETYARFVMNEALTQVVRIGIGLAKTKAVISHYVSSCCEGELLGKLAP